MALGLTQQLLREINTGIFLGVKGGRRARKADNLTDICEPIIQKMREPRYLTTLWASTICYRGSFTIFSLL
jgi:hypothetical protein